MTSSDQKSQDRKDKGLKNGEVLFLKQSKCLTIAATQLKPSPYPAEEKSE